MSALPVTASCAHAWVPDGHDKIGNVIEKCSAGGCACRKIENCSTFWQHAKGGRWRNEENEEIPPCTGASAKEAAHAPPTGQVAEDEAALRTLSDALRGCFKVLPVRHREILATADAAVPRLTEKAQGYEAAVAVNAALLERLRLIWHAGVSLDEVRGIAEVACQEPHPGAALLKEKQEQAETITALADVLERIRKTPGFEFSDAADAALLRAGRRP